MVPPSVDWLRAVGELEALVGDRDVRVTSTRPTRSRNRRRRTDISTPTRSAHPLMADEVSVRNDVRLGGDAPARDRGQRLQHVRQEHAAARHRHQRRAGAGRRPGPRGRAEALAAGDRRDAARRGFAAGGPLAVLRRDPPHPQHRRRRARSRSRCCSCSTRSCTGPTRTTAASARKGSSARSSTTAPSAWSPRTISRSRSCRRCWARAAVNMHFEDRLENGVMVFDYRMRPGVVEHSNALALMRAIGLDV